MQKLIDFNTQEQEAKDDADVSPPKLPLVRLKVDHSHVPCTVIANSRFGQQFVGKVANPDSLLLFHKKAERRAKPVRVPAVDENGQIRMTEDGNIIYLDELEQPEELGGAAGDGAAAGGAGVVDESAQKQLSMGEMLFGLMARTDLAVLPQKDFNDSISAFVEKGEVGAIERFVRSTIKATNAELFAAKDQVSVGLMWGAVSCLVMRVMLESCCTGGDSLY